ncbi:ATP-binding protein [Halorubrum trapanicum]|uniref:ATP-binding protein n=1 Tax=Halorubrum trapanicum TaxID=29284 RepID=UPI003C6FEA4C
MSDSKSNPASTNRLPSIFDTCTPRQDVLTGELAEDQFAASLADVAHSRDAPDVYANPALFFEKTYPTQGLQELLTRLTTRFVGAHNDDYTGTNGILRLDTSFGGGKTHNQIAAYHLAESPGDVPDLSDFILDQDIADEYTDAAALGLDVNTAVFVGTHVDAEDARSNYNDPDAPTTKTMWGEMAYQLFGREGYEFLRENDENRTPPGTTKLERLFERNDNPSLILLDEIAAYLEQAAAVEIGDSTLAKQTNTFLMSLLSATQNNDKVTVVLSIADTAFADQAEDVRGLVSETISEFNSISDRVEGSITPTEDNEIAAVLRHRLFEVVGPKGRDATVEEYASFYVGDRDSFPDSTANAEHRDRLEDSYPIHPTVIDTLTEELDSLPSFQRTRGALKLLSRGVYRLWKHQDENQDRHFVRLFDLHPSDGDVRSTLLRLFSSVDMDFEAAIKADIHSEDGTANAEEEDRNWVKNGHPPLGTQLTTTILWKSIVKGADGRGTTRRPLRHAIANTEVELAHYDDALNNLLGEGRRSACFYLHGDNGEKIQFKSEPNLTKLIDSVVEQLQDGLARRHLEEALDEALGQGSLNVIVGPEQPHEIPDTADEAHLCVMDFDTVTINDYENIPETIQMLFKNTASSSGGQKTPRVFKNNVVFLAASANDVTDAKRTAERVAAIKNIQTHLGDQYELNTEQQDKLGERLDSAKGTLDQDIKKAYTHLYFPTGNGLAHRNVTTDSTIHQSVIEKLDEAGAIIPEGEDAYGVDWFEATIWNVGATSMTTRALEEQFGKRQDAEILLSPIPLRKTIAQLVREDGYAYWDGEQSIGYYTSGSTLSTGDHDLDDAKNLETRLSYQDVKLSQSHTLYTSIDELVSAVERDLRWEEPEDEDETDETTTGGSEETSDENDTTEDPSDEEPFSKLIEVRTSGPAHVSRALQEMRADIADQLTSARDEYKGHPDELTPIVRGIWIRIDGADAWKGTWFTANKLSDSEDFAEDSLMEFEYEANDGGNPESQFEVEFEGRPGVFASHLRFNMEPEDLSTPDGGRTAESEFAIEFDENSSRLYGDTFDALDELLAVDNAFTVTMHTQVRVIESAEVNQV